MMNKIFNKVNATIKARKFKDILDSYQQHAESIIAQRNGWREIEMNPLSSTEEKAFARWQIVVLTNELTDIVTKRTKILESSF